MKQPGLSSTIQKGKDNQCTGKLPRNKEWKSHINCVVMVEWVPPGQTVTKQYYLKVLANVKQLVRKNRTEL